jgi:hypothetical protein
MNTRKKEKKKEKIEKLYKVAVLRLQRKETLFLDEMHLTPCFSIFSYI